MAKSLKIEHVDLTNVGGFESISVSFNAGFNLICGPNGVGKTTLLDVIGSIFVANYDTKTVRRRADTEVGLAKFSATVDGVRREGSGRIDGFEPNTSTHPFGFNDTSNQIIYVKSNRDFSYVNLQGVMRDPEKGEHNFQQDALNGISIDDVKQWFSNRYLMEPHGDHWPEYQRDNLRLAKSFLSMLDEEVSLSHVNSSTFDIMLSTRSGTIPFEYMSAGFRAAYSMIFGILKEVEFRGLGITASEFSGIILIDELDLHLHPTWHRVMMEGLQEAYPSAQIIVTTHSPHMIQAAKLESVIVLSAPPPRSLWIDPQ
jgi:AAA15 family ATPase/GTPase